MFPAETQRATCSQQQQTGGGWSQMTGTDQLVFRWAALIQMSMEGLQPRGRLHCCMVLQVVRALPLKLPARKYPELIRTQG
jgi:hypothetical protein